MDYITIIGIIATTLTTSSSIPQLLQIWKTKKTRDISLPMYATLCAGMSLWLAYGILRKDAILGIANTIGLMLYGSILVLKIKYK